MKRNLVKSSSDRPSRPPKRSFTPGHRSLLPHATVVSSCLNWQDCEEFAFRGPPHPNVVELVGRAAKEPFSIKRLLAVLLCKFRAFQCCFSISGRFEGLGSEVGDLNINCRRAECTTVWKAKRLWQSRMLPCRMSRCTTLSQNFWQDSGM